MAKLLRVLVRRSLVALLLVAVTALAVAVGLSRGLYVGRVPVFAEVLGWLALAPALAWAVGRAFHRRTVYALTLVVAIGLQGVGVRFGPQLSDDLYRYVWDGRVAAAGIDPYAHAPDSPALDRVRTPDLWPTVCSPQRSAFPRATPTDPFLGLLYPETGCTKINRPGVRTIYPPAAQLAFRVDDALTPDAFGLERHAELPAAVFSVLLTLLLLEGLRRLGGRTWLALAYAASPLAVVEAGMDAHIDVLAGLLGVGAVLVLARRRARAPDVALGAVLLAFAILTKLYPAALGVLLFARFGLRSRLAWLGAVVVAVVSVLLYVPHVVAVGIDVVGYLPGYLKENGYGSGDRYTILGALLPDAVTPVAAGLCLVAVAAWGVLHRVAPGRPSVQHALWVIGLALLVLTPGNPWYCALLVGLAVLAERLEWLAVVAANYTVYFTVLLNGNHVWSTVGYLLAAAVVLAATLARRSTAIHPPPALAT